MVDFSFAAKPASILLNQLLEKWAVWEKCRRCYKWLSIIPLFIAYAMLFCSGALFHVGVVLCGTGDCCSSFGHSMGKTDWFDVDRYGNRTYSHTQDDGACCKIIGNLAMIAGWACIFVCLAFYALSWFFLAATFIFMYEEVDYSAPLQWWVLRMGKDIPTEMAFYLQMNRNTSRVGTIRLHGALCGQHVYTGWIKVGEFGELEGGSRVENWVYCNRRGKCIFDGFTTKEEAELFIQQQMSQSTEVDGVPIVGDHSRVYPMAPVPANAEGVPMANVVEV